MSLRNILLVALGTPMSLAAQIEWLATDYDFGIIKEAAGPKTGQVRFVNHGSAPTAINQVRPSCGCTGADFTHGEILPGDTATVSFTYDPKGRPGRFEKTVKVYTGEDNSRTVITIRGTVIGAPETLSSSYPIEAGPLRLSNRLLPAGDVRYGTSRHLFLQGYNQSADTIWPDWGHPARSLSLGISNKAVAPGDLVTFSIYFNSREEDAPGTIVYPIEIVADTHAVEKHSTTVEFRANVIPDTSGPGASQLADAPVITITPPTVDLGNVTDTTPFRFIVSNSGKSELHIKRIYGEGTIMKRFPVRLKPGKTGECSGSLSMAELPQGPFSIKLEIVSNDPVRPVFPIRLVGIKE